MCSDFHRSESGTEVRAAEVGARETRTGPWAGEGAPRAREAGARRGGGGARGPDAGEPRAPPPKPVSPEPAPETATLRAKPVMRELVRHGTVCKRG